MQSQINCQKRFLLVLTFTRIRLKKFKPDKPNKDIWQTKDFSWQEKRFSKVEQEFYGDVNNCITDLEKTYNNKILNNCDADEEPDNVIFTYVNQDEYESEQEISHNKDVTYLQRTVESMSLNDQCLGHPKEYDHKKSIVTSMENPIVEYDFEKMYIMADFGEYVDETWIRNYQTLCVLKFDKISKVLMIYPDFTTTQPYFMKIQGEVLKHVSYFIENGSLDFPEEKLFRESEIINRVTECKKSLKQHLVGNQFFLPPKHKLYLFLFFEIVSASNFENNDIYVQYTVDLPEYWSSENMDDMKGVTQTAHASSENGLVHFGHNFDIVLQYDLQSLEENRIPKNPYIYFEVISKGSWHRFTTEGLAYRSLPVSKPGCYLYNLSCFRFDTRGPSGRLRRFFIGDYSNYDDIKCIGLPDQNSQNKILNRYGANTIGTGQLTIRLNVVHQSQAFLQQFYEGDHKEKFIYEKLNASSLIRSVNQVLLAFKKARRNLIEARKDL